MISFIHPSNLLSYLSLFFSLVYVWGAINSLDQSFVGALLAISAICDTLDGKFASRFKRTEVQKKFGAELDSLTDMAGFGFALPIVILIYSSANFVSVICAFVFVLASITRLGYFNIFNRDDHKHFEGFPITIIGLLGSFLLFFQLSDIAACLFFIVSIFLMLVPFRISRPSVKVLALVLLSMVISTIVHIVRYVGV